MTQTIGRHREIATLTELMEPRRLPAGQPFGPAGVGKTRIAVGYAAIANSRHPDGVHWLPIGALDDAATAITAITGPRPEPWGRPGFPPEIDTVAAAIVDHLQQQSCLLIIDHAEHQLDLRSARPCWPGARGQDHLHQPAPDRSSPSSHFR